VSSRLLRLVALVAVVATAVVAAGLAGPRWAAAEAPAFELHEVKGAHFDTGPDAPLFVLLVGSDERPGLAGARADALQLVGVNPASGQGTILNIPRDTYVSIPGRGQGRINEAYHFGGAQLQAQTVAGLTGITPQFVLVTTFVGIEAMVDELGGVTVNVPYAMNDRMSGAVFPAGPRHMHGAEVLAMSRNRYVPGGDFGRTNNQGRIILETLSKLRHEGAGPTDTVRYMGALVRHTRLHDVAVADLYRLGRLALRLDPANIRNYTMPGRNGFAGPAAVVFPAPGASALFADLADDGVLQQH
jgi:polyisoprenyl-teichoic acid--peptidoglycan teichoic acid transferase